MPRESAFAAYNAGDIPQATAIVEAALEQHRGDEVEAALLRCDLVRYLYLTGRSSEAEKQLRVVESLTAGSQDEARAAWLNTRAWLFNNYLDFDVVLESAQAALALAEELGLARIEAESIAQLGVLAVARDERAQGLALAELALAKAKAIPALDLVAEIFINVTTSMEMQGDLESAIPYLENGYREIDAVHEPFFAATFLKIYLAQLLADTGRIDEAARLIGHLSPTAMEGAHAIYFRLVQAEIATRAGNLSAAMVWLDDIDPSGWAFSDQWNVHLEHLLAVIHQGLGDEAGFTPRTEFLAKFRPRAAGQSA